MRIVFDLKSPAYIPVAEQILSTTVENGFLKEKPGHSFPAMSRNETFLVSRLKDGGVNVQVAAEVKRISDNLSSAVTAGIAEQIGRQLTALVLK